MDRNDHVATCIPEGRGMCWADMCRAFPLLKEAFELQVECLVDVHQRAQRIASTPPGTPEEYVVAVGPLPHEQLTLRRNVFSTLFIATYHVLEIGPARRHLYGTMNQLFRSWVTSADNLLDTEDKVVLPFHLHGGSRVMREVVSIMTADRVLFELLGEAVDNGVASTAEAAELSTRSLQVLLPSAGQEASEEGGVLRRPSSDVVLKSVHTYKTGLLFHLPFLGPETLDHVDAGLLHGLKKGLLDFGLGCQLLDDTRDMARDFCEKRHNYLLSALAHSQPDVYAEQSAAGLHPDDRMYLDFPEIAVPAVREAYSRMCRGLGALSDLGLGMPQGMPSSMARAMVTLLDLGDMSHACVL